MVKFAHLMLPRVFPRTIIHSIDVISEFDQLAIIHSAASVQSSSLDCTFAVPSRSALPPARGVARAVVRSVVLPGPLMGD
jgi:hypothetical protein